MSTFSSANVTDGSRLLKERTHTIKNKIQLHILGVPPNKLGNWLIFTEYNNHCKSGLLSVAVRICYIYRALSSSTADRIPAARLNELQQIVRCFYGVEELDSSLLQQAASIDTRCVSL